MEKLILSTAIILSTSTMASAAEFEVDKPKSSIKFEAVQNGAPVQGEFKDYTAAIDFDKDKLSTSKAVIEIKIASVSASYSDISDSLKGAEWFDSAKFPTAKFEVTEFKQLQGNDYVANGKLTIRDKTENVPLNFTLKEYDDKHAVIEGATTISRNKFGVGQGEWKDTGTVKDEVQVKVNLVANTKTSQQKPQ